MKRMYQTTQPKDNKIVIHIGKVKTRTQMKTVRSATYSFYDRATRRAERQLKQELKNFY
jgi:molybdopterin synthase catalytic subunit